MELIFLIVLFGLIFDFTNGFHDAANVVSTVIATKVLTPFAAIFMASAMNMIGAIYISGVAKTIAVGLVNPADATQIVVIATLIGAILWNIFTWYYGIPSSSSYALIGGLLGAASIHTSINTILWNGVLFKVLLPMVISPLLGFCLGFLGMKGLSFASSHPTSLFRHLQIGSASLVALSHGLNDAQKSMGIITLGLFASGFIATPEIPLWVILTCAITMGLGTATGGFRIIRTMAFSITKLTPAQGFAAETSASCVILGASVLGMPISSTHMIAGSITGVGAARFQGAVQWQVPGKIALASFFTLPGAAAISISAYLFFSFFTLQA